jgi:hypothetical protein
MVSAAAKFINVLDSTQKTHALYPFDGDGEERYNFLYFPKKDWKGISFNELTVSQNEAAMGLLTCLAIMVAKSYRCYAT